MDEVLNLDKKRLEKYQEEEEAERKRKLNEPEYDFSAVMKYNEKKKERSQDDRRKKNNSVFGSHSIKPGTRRNRGPKGGSGNPGGSPPASPAS